MTYNKSKWLQRIRFPFRCNCLSIFDWCALASPTCCLVLQQNSPIVNVGHPHASTAASFFLLFDEKKQIGMVRVAPKVNGPMKMDRFPKQDRLLSARRQNGGNESKSWNGCRPSDPPKPEKKKESRLFGFVGRPMTNSAPQHVALSIDAPLTICRRRSAHKLRPATPTRCKCSCSSLANIRPLLANAMFVGIQRPTSDFSSSG